MTIIPVLPEMIMAVNEDPNIDVDDFELGETISGIFIAA